MTNTRSLRTLAVAFAAAVLTAASLGAQDLAPAPQASNDSPVVAVAAPVTTVAGPTVEAATAGVRNTTAARTTPMAAGHSQSQPVAMMIVGGAAILAGGIVGGGAGYAIAVGGAVVALVGLYQYLQ